MPQMNKATLNVAGSTIALRDVTITQTTATLDKTSTTDIYRQFLAGRIDTKISASVYVDSTSAGVVALLQGATNYPTSLTFTLADGITSQASTTYSGNCLLTSVSHAMTLDDVDIYSIELQVTGSIS